jgi:hypothetical protein
MSRLLKLVSFMSLAVGVFTAVIVLITMSNGRLEPSGRTLPILIMLIAFPLAILTNWWAKRM